MAPPVAPLSIDARCDASPNVVAKEAASNQRDGVAAPTARDRADTSTTDSQRRRRHFWRNVVKQFNFARPDERARILSLTDGVDWTHLHGLPRDFMARHREIYHLIAHGEYQRSGSIQRDVTRTFSIFERNKLPDYDLTAQHGALLRVLTAIAEAEDGYCQGMNFIAALFLVEGMEEADAYALFLYLLRKRFFARIFHRSSTFLDDYMHQFELMFRRTLPDLFEHMYAQGFSLPMFGIEWFTTMFSLSTRLDLACAVFDMFFVGIQDIFLRVGLAILKLLEAKLMCMTFEDFLREFKPWVRQIDPYQVVHQALQFPPNHLANNEDTAAYISRTISLQATSSNALTGSSATPTPPRSFNLHRTLPPTFADAICTSDFSSVRRQWELAVRKRPYLPHCRVLANEILHFATWFGRASIACFAIECCGADVDNEDDSELTPLHFAVIRNEPDLVRLLLVFGADPSKLGGHWAGTPEGLTPLNTARNWKFRDTNAARLVLEGEVCLYCNTRFDKLAFESETCRRCKFAFCSHSHALCIAHHQCPSEWRTRHDGEGSQVSNTLANLLATDHLGFAGDSTLDEADDANASSMANEIDKRHRSFDASDAKSDDERSASMTRSVSESSSLVFVNSPKTIASMRSGADEFIGDGSAGHVSSPHDGGLRFSEWLRHFAVVSPPAASEKTSNGDTGTLVSAPAAGLHFPDRPLWYCNARGCHAVFAFFTQALECSRCGSFFCSADFDASTKRCLACLPSPDDALR